MKISEIESWLFESVNKLVKGFSQIYHEKEHVLQILRWEKNSSTNPINLKKIRDIYKQLYTNSLKLRWYKFPERHKQPTLTQEETDNLKSHVYIRGIKVLG